MTAKKANRWVYIIGVPLVLAWLAWDTYWLGWWSPEFLAMMGLGG